MTPDAVLLIAEDDEGHAGLILRNLRRAGIANKVLRFPDGQEVLDFFLAKAAAGPRFTPELLRDTIVQTTGASYEQLAGNAAVPGDSPDF